MKSIRSRVPEYVTVAGLMLWLLSCSSAIAAAQDVSLQEMIRKPCPSAAAWISSRGASLTKEQAEAPDVAPKRPELRERVLSMLRADEAVRTPLQRAGEHPTKEIYDAVRIVDATNLASLREILASGHPNREDLGRDGQAALFMLILHADSDPLLQERALAENARQGNRGFPSDDAAMLSDRVALKLHKPQLYGSQLHYVDGRLVPIDPVSPRAAVDARREAVHLIPLKDYICMMTVLQTPANTSH